MRPRKEPGFARQGYHHGNLKEALVAAARRLIAERGPAGFTLSEAARAAGVSPAAPYRHFKDREALIVEVAQRGFAEFGRRLGAAWNEAASDAKAGFARMGEAYLVFARDEPGYYGAMFATGGAHSAPPRAGNAAFAGLQEAIARVAGEHARSDQKGALDPRVLSYQVWAMSHGIAMLSAAGYFSHKEPALRPEALLRSGVSALMAGIPASAPAKSARES